MLEHTSARSNTTPQSEARQVKALLRLVEDLGYEVDTSPAGDWTVTAKNEPADRTIVGVDSAREVAATARLLADALHIDHKPAVLHAHGAR